MCDDLTVPGPSPFARIVKRGIVLLLLLAFGGAGYIAYDAHSFMTVPAAAVAGREARDVIIDIQPGASFDRVAWDLYKAGAIADVFRFRALAKWRGKLGSVQAGEFAVNTGWLPEKILTYITAGNQMLYRLVLREGLPWWEVARLVEAGGFAKAHEFEAVIHDPEFLRRYGIPFANAEGFLYPETYLLRKPRDMNGRKQAEAVARVLVETFWKRSWSALARYAAANPLPHGTPVPLPDFAPRNDMPGRIPEAQAADRPNRTSNQLPDKQPQNKIISGKPPLYAPVSREALRHIVTLASLVEKETAVPEERARVAGVYANRLRLGMLLQCDPTILYGLGKNQSGPIRKSQLEDEKNLYNTYKHPGLPPGPICSPGAAAMAAAVAPEKHNYLYFVATGLPDGTHTFSTNITDHNKAVRAFRRTRR